MKYPPHRPKQIEFVEQKRKTDCGVACVAMLTGHMYDDVIRLFPEIVKRNGLHLDEIIDLLDAFGYNCTEVKNLPKRGVALIGIQWKAPDLSGHYIVWDSKRNQFLDPMHGIINKNNMLRASKVEVILRIVKFKIVRN